MGAILFANRLGDFEASLARKGVRFVAYDGVNRAAPVTHRHDGQKGYATGFEGLVGYLNDLLPKNEHIGTALREAHPLFPELAIRELVANALIHQDMTVTGAGPQIELFSDRIEITWGADAVKKALDEDQIAWSRYKSYLQILEGDEEHYRTDLYNDDRIASDETRK
mgnify:CR=1 FL=1